MRRSQVWVFDGLKFKRILRWNNDSQKMGRYFCRALVSVDSLWKVFPSICPSHVLQYTSSLSRLLPLMGPLSGLRVHVRACVCVCVESRGRLCAALNNKWPWGFFQLSPTCLHTVEALVVCVCTHACVRSVCLYMFTGYKPVKMQIILPVPFSWFKLIAVCRLWKSTPQRRSHPRRCYCEFHTFQPHYCTMDVVWFL